ncbi:Serine/threonine-protein phosphatase 6 regulatory ankyrin repeat subunit C [Podospora fimiseda]|uniref:Serine/threonine-protein phosphatase 6 regulatory ankyrin repeat subunit C n=1 Tax=Podospora fimiseda TaxID=252190 RepID=A0AAN7GT85_9PEZI|nr:Serine/threonine-protein phosphatase 6 regulatory ankyrin repeat subunit C [Podospora fimiseda]
MAALTVNHHPIHTWDDSPTLASTRRMSRPPPPQQQQQHPDPFTRMGWKPTKTRTPRQQPCRELVKPNKSLPQPSPSVWVHGSRCRCIQEKQERESADQALAQVIETISTAYRAKRKLELEVTSPRPAPPPPHRQSRSAGLITRIFKLSSPQTKSSQRQKQPPLTIQEIADLCNATADLDIKKISSYLFSSSCPSTLLNTPNHRGTTPLMACLRASSASIYPKAHLSMLSFLLDCGANPNAITSSPSGGHAPGLGLGAASVLSIACALDLPCGQTGRIVKLLLDRGAAVDVGLPCNNKKQQKKGQTAVHIATLAGNAEALEVLLGYGTADVDRGFDASSSDRENEWELPPTVHIGKRNGLLGRSHHRRTTSRMKNPVTALHLAHGSPACAKVLLEHKADVRVKDGYGRTPLHWAAEFGSVQVVGLLLDAGAQVGDDVLGGVVVALESGGGRPGHVGVARLLIGRGAADGNGMRERLLAVEEWKHVFEDIFAEKDKENR